jgi:hypothetical protein
MAAEHMQELLEGVKEMVGSVCAIQADSRPNNHVIAFFDDVIVIQDLSLPSCEIDWAAHKNRNGPDDNDALIEYHPSACTQQQPGKCLLDPLSGLNRAQIRAGASQAGPLTCVQIAKFYLAAERALSLRLAFFGVAYSIFHSKGGEMSDVVPAGNGLAGGVLSSPKIVSRIWKQPVRGFHASTEREVGDLAP